MTSLKRQRQCYCCSRSFRSRDRYAYRLYTAVDYVIGLRAAGVFSFPFSVLFSTAIAFGAPPAAYRKYKDNSRGRLETFTVKIDDNNYRRVSPSVFSRWKEKIKQTHHDTVILRIGIFLINFLVIKWKRFSAITNTYISGKPEVTVSTNNLKASFALN